MRCSRFCADSSRPPRSKWRRRTFRTSRPPRCLRAARSSLAGRRIGATDPGVAVLEGGAAKMPHPHALDRRAFLHSATAAALAGAVAPPAMPAPLGTTRYDFDTVLNRFGTDCVKFDKQIREYGKDS